jgi:hypothetical protein
VREHGVVPHLVQLGIRKHKRRCEQYAVRLATANVGFHALMAVVGKRAELVEREDVLDAVAELLRQIARVLAERLRGVGRLPAAEPVLKRLGRSQW